jgi:hypothetical protein
VAESLDAVIPIILVDTVIFVLGGRVGGTPRLNTECLGRVGWRPRRLRLSHFNWRPPWLEGWNSPQLSKITGNCRPAIKVLGTFVLLTWLPSYGLVDVVLSFLVCLIPQANLIGALSANVPSSAVTSLVNFGSKPLVLCWVGEEWNLQSFMNLFVSNTLWCLNRSTTTLCHLEKHLQLQDVSACSWLPHREGIVIRGCDESFKKQNTFPIGRVLQC